MIYSGGDDNNIIIVIIILCMHPRAIVCMCVYYNARTSVYYVDMCVCVCASGFT